MQLNDRILFYREENSKDADGYRINNPPEVEYKCWANINKYFSKLQFEATNLDINKSLNISIRYCKKAIELLSDENVKNIIIEFNKVKYTVANVDPYRYPKEYIVMVGIAHG